MSVVGTTGRVIFTTNDGDPSRRFLWVTDGTEAGTIRLANIIGTGDLSFNPTEFAMLGDGRLVFNGADDAAAYELWVTDGTVAGTGLLADISDSSSFPRAFTSLPDGRVLFSARTGNFEEELWVTDGTEAGTREVTDLNPSGPSAAQGLTPLSDGRVIFAALLGDRSFNYELAITDGTRKGTVYVADIRPGTAGSSPQSFTQLGDGRVVFSAWVPDGNFNRELYITDGTTAGTALLADIAPGELGSSPRALTQLGDGRVVFSADRNTSGRELWVTDGTAAGTRLVADINPGGAGSSDPGQFALLGDGRLVFQANDGVSGLELWVTNGTAAGTTRVADLNAGASGSDPRGFTALGDGRLLFSAADAATGRELWVTDGTAAGTTQVADIGPGDVSGSPEGFTALGDGRFVFRATDAAGTELWVTDGTTAGTGRLADLTPRGSSVPDGFFPIGFNNQPPVVVGRIGKQHVDEEMAFRFTFAPDVFADRDAGDVLTFTATLMNGVALPAWLTFDSATRTFAGTPTEADADSLFIDVTATDAAGESAKTSFTITVRDRVIGTAAYESLRGDPDTPEVLAGRGGNDRLEDGSRDDALRGNAGDDTLEGGNGSRAVGGGGADAFFYNWGPSIIVDFEVGVDRIEVSAADFIGTRAGVALTAAQFVVNAAGDPVGEAAQFIYKSTNGRLLWDANGEAVGQRSIVFQINGAPALEASDIVVIA